MNKHSITDFYIFAGVLIETQHANADTEYKSEHTGLGKMHVAYMLYQPKAKRIAKCTP